MFVEKGSIASKDPPEPAVLRRLTVTCSPSPVSYVSSDACGRTRLPRLGASASSIPRRRPLPCSSRAGPRPGRLLHHRPPPSPPPLAPPQVVPLHLLSSSCPSSSARPAPPVGVLCQHVLLSVLFCSRCLHCRAVVYVSIPDRTPVCEPAKFFSGSRNLFDVLPARRPTSCAPSFPSPTSPVSPSCSRRPFPTSLCLCSLSRREADPRCSVNDNHDDTTTSTTTMNGDTTRSSMTP